MMMQTFKIRPGGFKEIKKQILIRTIPVMLVALTAGVVITSVNSKAKMEDVNILPYYIPFIAILIAFGMYRGIIRQKKLFDSYTLTISNNLISREQLNTQTIIIYFNEIKEIVKHKNGSFTIRGKDTRDLIGVPPQIDKYLELERVLQEIQPIIFKNEIHFLQKYPSFTGLVTVGLMLCVYTVNNKIIVGVSGTTLVVLMIWNFIKIRSSKNIDSKTKGSVWLILVVLASVISVMIFKLTGIIDMQKH